PTPPADLGWGRWLGMQPRVLELPGSRHFTMLRPPTLSAVAERLTELLQALEVNAA
ncbi:hypothetical protein HG543_01255, partial [Pyxidicoccus fallax]|nr:hypothetical protein [Pyxidicoccus fallax]